MHWLRLGLRAHRDRGIRTIASMNVHAHSAHPFLRCVMRTGWRIGLGCERVGLGCDVGLRACSLGSNAALERPDRADR